MTHKYVNIQFCSPYESHVLYKKRYFLKNMKVNQIHAFELTLNLLTQQLVLSSRIWDSGMHKTFLRVGVGGWGRGGG